MKLTISKNADINYLAKLVHIDEFFPHPNPEVTRMKEAHIDGYKIAVGINENPGWFIYFPTMCQINPSILSYLNLYSDKKVLYVTSEQFTNEFINCLRDNKVEQFRIKYI